VSEPDNIVSFRAAGASALFKDRQTLPERRLDCRHKPIWVYADEPILECRNCGAIVDPFRWIRDRVNEWKSMQAAVDWKIAEAKRELDGLRTAIRQLRGEWKDESEKRRTLMIQPPRKSF
jgi:hypothetical protein